MAFTIALASMCLKAIDALYAQESLTDVLRGQSQYIEGSGANEVKVLKVSTQGLANHSRTTGVVVGDATAAWETLQLTQERSRRFKIDRMDDEETLGLTMAAITGNFVREQVVPEVDAYRFTKMFSGANAANKATGTLTTTDALRTAIATAAAALTNAGVPTEGRYLFVNTNLEGLLSGIVNTIMAGDGTVDTRIKGLNGMKVVSVPDSRFHTVCTINASGAGGYTAGGQSINFMIVHPSAVVAPVKLAIPKIFDPDSDDENDDWRYIFRLYHDLFVFDNKNKGIAVHSVAAS